MLTARLCLPARGQASVSPGMLHPDVRVEYFGADKGYSVGMETVTLLCVVRNMGTGPSGENALRLRCAPVSGLDYTSGNLTPTLPALVVNQAVAYRWRLAPSDAGSPLIASLVLESVAPTTTGNPAPATSGNGSASDPPQISLATIARFAHPFRFGDAPAEANGTPRALYSTDEAFVGNNRVGLRITANDKRQVLFMLASRTTNTWTPAAIFAPALTVRSGEEGQIAWWEAFRWRDTRAGGTKDAASLTLLGTLGTRWRAELTLEAARDTAALTARLHLVALRPMRCESIQLPRLFATTDEANAALPHADGTALPLTDAPALLPDDTRACALRAQGIAFGLTWPTNPFLANGRWNALHTGDGYSLIQGVQCDAGGAGVSLAKGAALDVIFRLFAYSPSDTIKDALRFVQP